MILRYLLAAVLAAVVTLALFFEMRQLIYTEARAPERNEATKLIEFVRLRRDSELQLKERQLPERQQADEAPPPLPELNLARSSRPDQQIQSLSPAIDFSLDLAGSVALNAAPTDTDVIPLVRVNPQYPVRAMERGIEGWVEVQFTIGPTGTVRDPVVLASQPSSIFDRAALQAIRKWKYKPRVENGVPVERPGVIVRLTFKLENG